MLLGIKNFLKCDNMSIVDELIVVVVAILNLMICQK